MSESAYDKLNDQQRRFVDALIQYATERDTIKQAAEAVEGVSEDKFGKADYIKAGMIHRLIVDAMVQDTPIEVEVWILGDRLSVDLIHHGKSMCSANVDMGEGKIKEYYQIGEQFSCKDIGVLSRIKEKLGIGRE